MTVNNLHGVLYFLKDRTIDTQIFWLCEFLLLRVETPSDVPN